MKRGFSRLEVMLFLGVLVTSTALVWPVSSQGVFWRARENARRSACQSNLKQLGLAVMQYAQDYDEKLPRAVSSGSRSGFGWARNIEPYLQSREVFNCPSEKSWRNDNPTQKFYTDYWFNRNLSGKSLAEIMSPAQTIQSGDGDGSSMYSNARYAITSLPKSWIQTPESPARRHWDGANYGFADGHVKWIRPQQITTSPTQSKAGRHTFSIR